MEAIAGLLSIARLPPGQPVTAWRRLPGSNGTWPLDILVCSEAHWPPQTTSSRANGRTIRAHERADETAPPGHGPAGHSGHGRPLLLRPVTAVTAGHGGHGQPRPNGGTEGRDGGGGGRRERSTRERYCCTTHTGERTSERTDRMAGSAGDTALPQPGRIAARARSQRAWQALPVTAVTASQGRTFQRGVTTPTSR